jgi:hypothetical protein
MTDDLTDSELALSRELRAALRINLRKGEPRPPHGHDPLARPTCPPPSGDAPAGRTRTPESRGSQTSGVG